MGHDLKTPYIILNDLARTALFKESLTSSVSGQGLAVRRTLPLKESKEDLMAYVGDLLSPLGHRLKEPLLSPSVHVSKGLSAAETAKSMQEIIDLAIIRSTTNVTGRQSANRFEIARNGRRVAVIKLMRPAYRLGETVFGIIDYNGAEIPCYSVFVTLEASELVDPTIALRSSSSIYRATRKTHASFAENTLYCLQTSFSLGIQPSCTPRFISSGISLEWKLKFEFVTTKVQLENDSEASISELLKEVAHNERSNILIGTEVLLCENFEVGIPITVYGASSDDFERLSPEGLLV